MFKGRRDSQTLSSPRCYQSVFHHRHRKEPRARLLIRLAKLKVLSTFFKPDTCLKATLSVPGLAWKANQTQLVTWQIVQHLSHHSGMDSLGGRPPQGTHPRASLQSGFKSPLYRRQLQDPGHLVSSPANSDELVCILRLKLPGTGGAFNSQHAGFPSLQGTTEIQQIHRQARLFLEQQNTRCCYSQDAFFTGA